MLAQIRLSQIRRPATALFAAALLSALAACGGSDGADPAASGGAAVGELAEVSFEGEVGTGLTATWNSVVEVPETTKVTTLIAGSGEPIESGDTVTTYLYAGDGTKQKDVYSDYDNGAPVSIPFDEQLGKVLTSMFEGSTYGSRVAAVTTANEMFAESGGENGLGFGPEDSLVVVADLVEKAEVAPEPSDDTAQDADPATQPTVVEADGTVTGLDFSGIEEPALDMPLQRVVLKEGTGAAVKATDTVSVNYLGTTYDAETPFDESFSGEPLTSPLSGLIPGWSIGLTDVKVGSRVLLQIPPAFGYGAQGSPPAIPANATLWFVIDVLEATQG